MRQRTVKVILIGIVAFLSGTLAWSQQTASVKSQRTTPVKLVIPTYGERDLVINAWNAGLGREFDYVNDAPLADNFADLERVKVGTHCWTNPSFEYARTHADTAPKTIRCFNYDFESWSHTPKAERDDIVGTSKALRDFCNARQWKLAIGPQYRHALKLAPKVGSYYDIFIVQCQKFQNDQRREKTVQYLREVEKALHQVNPKCLLGCQLGSSDTFGNGQPGDGVRCATALYESTKDFVQIYGVWWPPNGKALIALLQAMDASPASSIHRVLP